MGSDPQELRRQFRAHITKHLSREENAAAYDAYAKDYEKVRRVSNIYIMRSTFLFPGY